MAASGAAPARWERPKKACRWLGSAVEAEPSAQGQNRAAASLPQLLPKLLPQPQLRLRASVSPLPNWREGCVGPPPALKAWWAEARGLLCSRRPSPQGGWRLPNSSTVVWPQACSACLRSVSAEEASVAGPGQQVQVPNPSTPAPARPGNLRVISFAALVRLTPSRAA